MSVNPFDLRSALLAKHAQHVVLIHFPIALFLAGVALDFVAQWTRRATLSTAAYINFLLAAVAALPTVATGLVAWQWALEGQRLKGVLLIHLVLGLISAGFIWTVGWIHFRARRRAANVEPVAPVLPAYRLLIEVIGVAIVGFTAHLGGILSGVNV